MLKKLALLSAITLTVFVVNASYTFGQVNLGNEFGQLNWGQPSTLSDLDSVSNLLVSILNWVFGVLLAIGVAFLLYAGFLYITAQGADDKLKKAKKTLTWAIIGIAIALASKGIVVLISNILY
jgi:hypothetical protein